MAVFGRWLVGATVVAASVAPVAVPVTACAGEGDRAALVVDTGEGVHRYCVALPDDEVSGAELIVLAAEQHGLSYRFGYGGNAVCMLAGVGTTGDDCFDRYPDFWGYWRGDGSGGWSWSGTGAGSTRVSDGDVEGWSWGSGGDGSSHPVPPATTFSSVCASAASPPSARPQRNRQPRRDPAPREQQQRHSTQRTNPPAAEPADTEEADGNAERRGPAEKRRRTGASKGRAREGRDRSRSIARPSPTSSATPALTDAEPVAAPASDRGGGPPAAGVAALVVAGALGGAGTWVARRRRIEP